MFESGLWFKSCVLAGSLFVGAYVIFGGPTNPRRRRRKRDVIPGLANIGNSCFLNALVQSLASCPLFMAWLASRHTQAAPPLLNTLHNLLRVLNNEGTVGGDACAGQVLGALRGHGWVITSEEQDTHELFHVLTATIEDEIISGAPVPSLLDVSWLDMRQETTEEGILLRATAWRLTPTRHKTPGKDSYISGKTHKKDELNGVVSGHVYEAACSGGCESARESEGSVRSSTEVNVSSSDRDSDKDNAKFAATRIVEGLAENILSQEINRKMVNGTKSGKEKSSEISDVDEFQSYSVVRGTASSGVPQECDRNKNLREGMSQHNTTKSTTKAGGKQHTGSTHRSGRSEHQQQDIPFRGYLASQLQCTICGHKNPAQWSSFESLSLSLPSLPWGDVSLQELLDAYITREQVSGVSCESCSRRTGTSAKTTFTKQLTIGKLPDCLCFHVKRTVWLENGSAIKRRDHLIFPEFLIMDPYTYTTSITNQDLQKSGVQGAKVLGEDGGPKLLEDHPITSVLSMNASASYQEPSPFMHVAPVHCDQLYRLKAVIVHVGDVFCGHFVTYRRGPVNSRTKNRWFYTSDLMVREASLEEVRKANAYMILFEKVA